MTVVEDYWTIHTVNSTPFESPEQSLGYLEWRNTAYPLAKDLCRLWGNHRDDVVLDYGCGPGHDVIGFLIHGDAKHVIAMDVSATSLDLTSQRLALHGIDPERRSLKKIHDLPVEIPLADGSVDYINSLGVLHHVSDPVAVLREFRRVLKSDGEARVMVYNRESIFFHLNVAYIMQIQMGIHAEMTTDEAFSHVTDGEECPISIAYRPAEFAELCREAGFEVEYLGAYFAQDEIVAYQRFHGSPALDDERLAPEHREFIGRLVARGSYPTNDGYYAGAGSVFRLTK